MNKPHISKGIRFAGNDYLGLAEDPRLIDAFTEAGRTYGLSATSSRWGLGWTQVHQDLEDKLTDIHKTEDTVILGAAYFGGPVYFAAMKGRFDTVYCDETVHSNQFLGMKAEGYTIHTFKHLDADDLEIQIKKHKGKPPIIATDSVYGISGEVAPLRKIADLAHTYGAELFIDDAHGVFAMGETGRGTCEYCGLAPEEATVLGSMSKALGCNGGFITGKKDLVEIFRRGPAASGSAIPPPPLAASCLKACEIVQNEPELRNRMWENQKKILEIMHNAGIKTVSEETPILAMELRDEDEARNLSEHLLERGFRIPYFRYASEPRENLLRAAAKANYTDNIIGQFTEALYLFPF
jgi:7-keto-8-aminopelargonate synthetase-like enzyme